MTAVESPSNWLGSKAAYGALNAVIKATATASKCHIRISRSMLNIIENTVESIETELQRGVMV